MYKLKITICILSLAFLFSCSNEDNEGLDSNTINLTIESSSATFKVGDAIGLFVEKRTNDNTQSTVGTNNYKTNLRWIYQEDGSWKPASTEDVIYSSTDGMPLDIYAYYPYSSQAKNGNIEISSANRIMTGTTLCEYNNAQPKLILQDKMTLVKVIVPDMDILSTTQVTMIDVLNGGVINLTKLGRDDDFTPSTSKSNQDLNLEKGSFVAYLPEQIFEENKHLLDIKNGDKTTEFITSASLQVIKDEENVIVANNGVSNIADMPNSFMLNTGDDIYISVRKAYDIWKTNSLLASSSPDMSGDISAKIVWQEGLHEVVETLNIIGTGESALIHAKTKTDIPGNAVIAVKIGETIRWSWHLWVSDYNPSSKTNGTTYDFNGFTFMDRNLGATSDPNMGGDKTFGLYYQWGRKDAFQTRGKVETSEVEASIEANLAKSISYPNTHITSSTSPNDWYTKTGSQGLDRWNSASNKKTEFDPCPKGWRVPAGKTSGVSPWNELTLPLNEGRWGNGWYFDESQALGYYPAAGQRTAAGSTTYAGSAGFYHTGGTANSTMRFDFTTIVFNFGGGKAAGRSVRCVKE